MTKKTEVVEATKEQLPAYMNQGTARGQENVGIDDLSIPRLDVIQALSPQRKKTAPEYIEGAEEGMLFNSVTGVLYGTEVDFVPVYFRKEYLVWKERTAGGGFAGSYATPGEARAEADRLGPDYEPSETAMHFGMVIENGKVTDEVVISMSRSKLKASRQLNTLVKMVGGDRFCSSYKVTAVEVSGDKGEYFNLTVKRTGYVEEDVYKRGEKLYDSIASGGRDVNRTYDEEVSPESDSENDVPY